MPCNRVGIVLRVLMTGLPDKGLGFGVIAVAIILIASVIMVISSVIFVIAGAITTRQGVVVAPDRGSQAHPEPRTTHANARVSALSLPVLKPAARNG
jgi:hypothetical protein